MSKCMSLISQFTCSLVPGSKDEDANMLKYSNIIMPVLVVILIFHLQPVTDDVVLVVTNFFSRFTCLTISSSS